MIEINSVNNPTIKSLRKLEQKKYRKKTQTYLIEGFHLVEEALKNHENYLYVLGTAEALKKLDASYKLKDDKVIQITDAISQHLSSTKNSQDIFMVLPINQPKSFSFEYGKWVVLDNLTDPGNVGTIIRTADAAGFDGVVLSKESVDLYNPKVQRSMQGSQFHIQIIQNPILLTLTEGQPIIKILSFSFLTRFEFKISFCLLIVFQISFHLNITVLSHIPFQNN